MSAATSVPLAPSRKTIRTELWLLVAGIAVSTAGDSAALVALMLRLRPDGSAWLSALLAAQLVPGMLLATVAGRLVDRYENRRLMLVALAGQAGLAVLLAFAAAPVAIVAVFTALACCTAVVRPATAALLPAITGEERAAHGYSWLATGTGMGWIAGPAAGGVLVGTIGLRPTLLADAATFVVLALACLALRTRRDPAAAHPGATAARRSGLRQVFRDRVLRVSLTASAIAVACAVVDNVAAPSRFVGQLHAGSAGYGTYLTLWGAGVLLGAQVPRRIDSGRQPAALACGNLLAGLGIAGIGLVPHLSIALFAAIVGGIGNGVANVAQNTLVSHRSSPEHRGQAFAALGAIVQAATSVGTAAAAPIVIALHANGAFLAAGVVSAACAIAGLALTKSTRGRAASRLKSQLRRAAMSGGVVPGSGRAGRCLGGVGPRG